MHKKIMYYVSLLGMILLYVSLFSFVVFAPPPQPHPIQGFVFSSGTVQVDAGTIVRITNLNNSQTSLTKTTGPPIPGLGGSYGTDIFGDDNDAIRVRAWNSTHYGESSAVLQATTTYANVTMNLTRPSETNVTIHFPQNNSNFEAGIGANVTANISILGNNGVNCNATLRFSTLDIFVLQQGESYTHDLGNINLGEMAATQWNITANKEGSTNITVYANCSSDGINLEHENIDTVYGISSADTLSPAITIVSPVNHSRKNNPVQFFFNVTDGSGIENCSLYINDLFQQKKDNPEMGASLNFTQSVGTKYNDWYINCTDNSTNRFVGTSGVFNLTINTYPGVDSLSIENPVNLVAAGNKTVACNGTASDQDGFTDVTNVNASFFAIGASEGSPDNLSNHYTESSCQTFGGSGNTLNFNCTFNLTYYAANGSWSCNVTLKDSINATNSSKAGTMINELLAMGATPSVINFGEMSIADTSPVDVPVTLTNFGNVALDLELYGFASFDDDEQGMNCDQNNISVGFEHFETTGGLAYGSMTPLNGKSSPNSVNLNLPQSTEAGPITKNVYWKLQIPQGVQGNCNGKIVFTAVLG